MIVVDASAIVAIYLGEPERRSFIRRIKADGGPALMSPINLWEALARAHAENGEAGRISIERLLSRLEIEIVSIDADTARAAADAFARFGKRTPAALNLGDCFAYALARQRNAPPLYDVAKTDITAA